MTIHAASSSRCAEQRCPGHGRLLVVERLLPKQISTSSPLNPAIAMDLGMLVNFGDARERYLDEYEELLGSCGFAVHKVIGLSSGFRVPIADRLVA
jgi:hypothetical protein